METKAAHYIGRALQPSLSQIQVDFQGQNHRLSIAPFIIPPIANNETKLIYALFPKGKNMKIQEVLVKAVGPSGPICFEVPLEDLKSGNEMVEFTSSKISIQIWTLS